jgi:GntR family transcriptional repressor for pyruvate dehydrogenase complex
VNAQPFAQLSREPTLVERVAGSILDRIVSGELQPGDKLPSERELGEQFGVSRTVVREAVRGLTGRGVVTVRAGSGLRVAAIDPAAVSESLALLLRSNHEFDYRHVHEVRVVLEVEIAGVAAERAGDEDIERVRRAAVAMEHAKSVDQAALRDLDFHRAIATATRNPFYLVLHDAIGDALVAVRRENHARGGREDAVASHRQIVDCIVAHDRRGAEAAMRHHLEVVERLWTTSHDTAQTAGSSIHEGDSASE